MYIGRVTGTVVATIHDRTFDAHKTLLVTRLGLDGRETAEYDIAVDLVQAGVGDIVLILDEGNSGRQLLGQEPDGVIRACIVGIVDEVDVP
jgi:microcompartment protein CcmK/EutM